MKTICRCFGLLAVISFLFFACDKEEKKTEEEKKPEEKIPEVKENFLKIGDSTYKLVGGMLENYGVCEDMLDEEWAHDGYNIDLTLISQGLQISNNYEEEDFQGKGHMVYFEMFTSNPDCLDSGKYSFSTNIPFPVKSFDYAMYFLNYVEGEEDFDVFFLSEAEVNVKIKDDIYEISFITTDENGVKVEGYYKGKLKYFDYSYEYSNDRALKSNKKKNHIKIR